MSHHFLFSSEKINSLHIIKGIFDLQFLKEVLPGIQQQCSRKKTVLSPKQQG
jgi:hypothetical protein